MATPRIFISHSSRDAEIARALVLLLRTALNVAPPDIRCTSVEGHRLAGGAQTDDELRRELIEAVVVIGLISPASIESAYVLFELGARWGAGKNLIPLLVPGAEAEHLKGPLGSMNALRVQSEEQLHQLLGEVAEQLGIKMNSPATFLGQLRSLAAMPPQSVVRVRRKSRLP